MMLLRAGIRVHETCDLFKNELQKGPRSESAYIRGKRYKDRAIPIGLIKTSYETIINLYIRS